MNLPGVFGSGGRNYKINFIIIVIRRRLEWDFVKVIRKTQFDESKQNEQQKHGNEK